jgi:hypothetical protein
LYLATGKRPERSELMRIAALSALAVLGFLQRTPALAGSPTAGSIMSKLATA